MKFIVTIAAMIMYSLFISCQTHDQHSELVEYLESNWKTPEDYVIEKFKTHDYIFLGEYHRIKHDIELVLSLIPKLHANGVNVLGIEFGDYKDQYLVDSLLELPYFDRELAKEIIYNCYPLWGYSEYIDIYRIAWETNNTEENRENKFRVVNLSAYFDPCKKGGAWKDVDPDAYMAKIIFQEIVSKNQKALIYSGNHHAFTRYHQPRYNFKTDTLTGMTTDRMGNIVYDSLKNRVFNIYLHSAWVSNTGWDDDSVVPVNGVIDSVMTYFENQPVGFDVVNSPFGKLSANNSYYAFGYPDFTLDKYCDGYIFQNAFKDYQPITMEDNFITPNNIDNLKKFLSCLEVRQELIDRITVKNANEELFEDIRKHFNHLSK